MLIKKFTFNQIHQKLFIFLLNLQLPYPLKPQSMKPFYHPFLFQTSTNDLAPILALYNSMILHKSIMNRFPPTAL